jgi:urease gamma subunit
MLVLLTPSNKQHLELAVVSQLANQRVAGVLELKLLIHPACVVYVSTEALNHQRHHMFVGGAGAAAFQSPPFA